MIRITSFILNKNHHLYLIKIPETWIFNTDYKISCMGSKYEASKEPKS